MACKEFESLMSDYRALDEIERARVESHIAYCESCRALFEVLCDVDAALDSAYGGVVAPPELAALIRSTITHPAPRSSRVSLVPEILDFTAWAAVLFACGLLAYFLLPRDVVVSQTALFAVSGILLCVALTATVWALRGSEG